MHKNIPIASKQLSKYVSICFCWCEIKEGTPIEKKEMMQIEQVSSRCKARFPLHFFHTLKITQEP